MRTIHKFSLNVGQTKLNLPLGAQCLSVQFQDGFLRGWFELDDSQKVLETRTFQVFGTGNPLPDCPLAHIATVQENGTTKHGTKLSFVWHVFEVL